MTKLYNYDPNSLLKEEVEYKVPTSNKIARAMKLIIVAALALLLFIKVGVENLEKLGTEKSQTNKNIPFSTINYNLTESHGMNTLLPVNFLTYFDLEEISSLV